MGSTALEDLVKLFSVADAAMTSKRFVFAVLLVACWFARKRSLERLALRLPTIRSGSFFSQEAVNCGILKTMHRSADMNAGAVRGVGNSPA